MISSIVQQKPTSCFTFVFAVRESIPFAVPILQLLNCTRDVCVYCPARRASSGLCSCSCSCVCTRTAIVRVCCVKRACVAPSARQPFLPFLVLVCNGDRDDPLLNFASSPKGNWTRELGEAPHSVYACTCASCLALYTICTYT